MTDRHEVPPVSAGLLGRLVGVFISAVALAAAAVLWFAASSESESLAEPPEEGLLFGFWDVFYDIDAPSIRAMVAAAALAVLLASAIALLERRASNMSRRSWDPRLKPLAPRVVMAATRGVFAGPITITVLIPAHNEEVALPATLASLFAQSQPPDRIIVVADNCTDGTVFIARQAGVDVFESVDNAKKKAGALNQALVEVLPGQADNDIVMVMDADTTIDPGFLDAAVRRFTNDRALMAIGGLFYGEEGFGLLGQLQRNEYVRYGREIRRRRGRVFVLTGTASMFRPAALRSVAVNRGLTRPGIQGDVYDTVALTEDNELTIALKTLGALMISPADCRVVTELMPTASTLWRQRLRWQRGALENIGAYGVTGATLRYWAQQVGIGYSVVALNSFFLLILLTALSVDQWIWFPFWLGIGSVFVVERVVTVWKGGWRARLLAATLVPELLFDLFLDLVYVKGIIDLTLGRQARWTHVVNSGTDLGRKAA
jgi:cellulose synthase/poly-beta-1,6-N-acetylglucosamine synthase-like glycosyltransferase